MGVWLTKILIFFKFVTPAIFCDQPTTSLTDIFEKLKEQKAVVPLHFLPQPDNRTPMMGHVACLQRAKFNPFGW